MDVFVKQIMRKEVQQAYFKTLRQKRKNAAVSHYYGAGRAALGGRFCRL